MNALFEKQFKISLLAVVLLVALRLGTGWHFLFQGLHKANNPGFTSANFLRQSKGPLAGTFRSFIPDVDGRARLGGGSPDLYIGSRDKSVPGLWNQHLAAFTARYALGPDQKKEAEALLGRRKAQLRQWFAENEEDIQQYLRDLEKLEADESNPRFASVAYHQKRTYQKRQELYAKLGPWLAAIEEADANFKRDLEGVLDQEQLDRAGRMSEGSTMLDWMDGLIIFSNVAIGLCLMLGLLTRFSAWCGAAFLFLIVLSQPAWPSIYPPPPPAVGHALIVNKELVEMLALMVLGVTAVGRWGGFDFFVHEFIIKRYFPGTAQEGQS